MESDPTVDIVLRRCQCAVSSLGHDGRERVYDGCSHIDAGMGLTARGADRIGNGTRFVAGCLPERGKD